MTFYRRIDRAWIVVAGCCAVALCSGLVMWSFGVFFTAVQDDLGGTQSAVSSAYTALIAANASAAIVTGRLSDRGHASLVLRVSAVLGSGAIALCSRAQSLAQLALLLVLVGMATGCTVPLAMSTVQRVFHKRRRAGLALAMVSAGIGLGALIFAPFLSHLILTSGWRNAFRAASAVFFALLVIGWASIRHGGASRLRDEPPPAQKESGESPPSARRLMRSWKYAGLAAITFFALTARNVLTVHLVPFAGDIGVSQTVAALALGLVGGLSIPSRIGSGLLSDTIGWQKTVRISLLGTGAALLLLPLASRSWLLLLLVALFGFWHGARAVGVMGLIGQVFRMRSVGQLIGTMVGTAQLAGAVGPYIAGLLHDYTGSYSAIFVGLGIALMALSLAVPRVPPIQRDEQATPTSRSVPA